MFEAVQKPLASYRIHENNLSKIKKHAEIEESEIWLEENKSNLSKYHIKKLENQLKNKKFLKYKIDGKYKDCISILLNSKKDFHIFKNFFLLFIPSFLLKKLLWF